VRCQGDQRALDLVTTVQGCSS